MSNRRRRGKTGRAQRATKDLADTAIHEPGSQATQRLIVSKFPGALPRREILIALVLGLAVVTAYYPALLANFVWDDSIFSKADVVRTLPGIFQIWFSPSDLKGEAHYWPVLYSTFWLEHKLWGFHPLGFHVVNVLLHCINSLLVWRLMTRLAVPGALVIAAVFALHPVHVEAVAWVIARKDLLSALFYLGAVLAWLRFSEGRRPGAYFLALAFFVFGMLSKTMTITLPAGLVILQWWKGDRLGLREAAQLLPFFLVGFGMAAAEIAYYSQTALIPFEYSLVERLLIAAQSLWFYAGKLIWPFGLAVIYPLWDIDVMAWGYLILGAALVVLLWFLRGRIGRGPLAGTLFFAVALSPVLGFGDNAYMQFSFVADRYQYLAGGGLLAVVVGAVAQALSMARTAGRLGNMRVVQASVLVLLFVLGALTWRQAGIYQSDVTLFSHIIAINPRAYVAYSNLGLALVDENRVEEGLAASRSALELNPDGFGATFNVGRALARLERREEAEKYLRQALQLDPDHDGALVELARLLRLQGRYEEAIEWYAAAIRANDKLAAAHAEMGVAQFDLRLYAKALASMELALSLQPELALSLQFDIEEEASLRALMSRAARQMGRTADADQHLLRARELASETIPALQNLAEFLRKHGWYEEALMVYDDIIAKDSGYAMVHADMGDVLLQMGRYAEAIEALRQAVALQPPGSPALHTFMGRAAQGLGLPGEAAEHFERALSIDASHIDALERLAALHFEGKRYANALTLYQQILAAAPDDANAHANLGAVLIQLGRREQAGASFERALALDAELQNAAALHLFLGEQAQDSGHIEAAVDQYRRALAVDAHNVIALNRLAVLYFGVEHYADALALYRQLVAIEPDNARAHSDLGAVLVKLGRSDEAILSLERALALDPDLETARLNLHAAEAQRLLTPR